MLKKLKKLPLDRQVFLCASWAAIVLVIVSLSSILALEIGREKRDVDDSILSMAGYVASLEPVGEMLEKGYPDAELSRQLDLLHTSFSSLNAVAVYNKDGLRFYHTSRRATGETLIDGEERPILEGADPYVATSYGTLGYQRKAFHAVTNSQGTVIGYVTVAVFTSSVLHNFASLTLMFLAVLGMALIMALLLSKGIVSLLRDSLKGHTPTELLELYFRQGNLINALDDALVTTDPEGTIILANQSARTLFGVDKAGIKNFGTGNAHNESYGTDNAGTNKTDKINSDTIQSGTKETDIRNTTLEGMSLNDLLPESTCIHTAQTGRDSHNLTCMIGEREILYSEVAMEADGQIHGVLNIFHDKTELRKLSDELSGTQGMLDTLRMVNHEFMNKLHIILGYLQTGQTQAALEFILNSSMVSSQALRETADCIRVSKLCALIIGKMMHAAERGVLLNVSQDSTCREEDLLLPVEDLATIVGNLLENAIEELASGSSETKEITLSIYCHPEYNLITCEDTGRGISPDILPGIWEKGISSKGSGRGLGLSLVRHLTDLNGGEIRLDTEAGVGTLFTLTFTRKEL